MLKALWKTLIVVLPRPVRGALAGLILFAGFLSLLALVPLVVHFLHR
jgi:hypothetical protein